MDTQPVFCTHGIDTRHYCLDCEREGKTPVTVVIREGSIWICVQTGERVKVVDLGILRAGHIAFIQIGKELQALSIEEFRRLFTPLGRRP